MPESYYTLESLQADNSVGFLIKRCGIVMTQIAERRFESQPVSFTQWMALMWLTQRPHASPTELSAHLGHDMGALTRVADELERAGMVRRERSRHDRRAVEIAITPEGRRVAHAGKRLLADLLNELVGPYSKAEVDALISMLQQLLLRLQDAARLAMPASPESAPSARRAGRTTAPASRTAAPGDRNRPRTAQRGTSRKSLE
jgi:DNA-binding MarR family transcriptional regulator